MKAKSTWFPSTYLAYSDLRLRPALDLLNRIPDDVKPEVVVDLGCGSGMSTRPLRRRWPAARVIGVDSSASMLAKACDPDIEWLEADVATWHEPADVVFSNACLHWLPDHDVLMSRLFDTVKPGGVLAVQMPRNFDKPSHALARQAAGPYASVLPVDPVQSPDNYHRILAPADVDAWETTYIQRLTGDRPVLDFVKGSYLNPLREALGEAAYAEFQARYAADLDLAYPKEPDGATFFPFTRCFFVARK